MAQSLGGVPRLIRETFYAPPCPEEVSLLLEVALTFHNRGNYEAAINSYMQALTKWEEVIFQDNFSELEDKDASSILARLLEQEKIEQAAEREILKQQQAEQEAAEASRAASSGETIKPKERDQREVEHERAMQEAEERAQEEAKRQEALAAEKREKRAEAIHRCYHMVPVEGKIHLRLSVASVLQSAGEDEKALGEALFALKLCQTLPLYTSQLMTASTFHALGEIYTHLSQYDYAADYFFRSLEIREHILGSDHVDVAMTMNNIGVILHLLDRAHDAIAMMYRAEKILAAQFPPTHPRVETVRTNIQRTKPMSLKGSSFPHVPYTPVSIPVIPGAKKAKQFYAPKPKKKKGEDDKKKGRR